jgi:hypothetical protein
VAWVFLGFFFLTINWWFFWSFKEVDWSYFRFLLALTPFSIFYIAASLLIPAEASAVECWRSHFFQIRRRLFALAIAYTVTLVASTVFLLGQPILHPRRILGLGQLLIFTVGFASDSPRTQAIVVFLCVALSAVGSLLFVAPGSLALLP